MTIIDHYGSFDEPEEKSEIEIIENPVLTATTLYELFNKKMEGLPPISLKYSLKDATEILYQEAIKFLEGKEKLNPKAEEIREIIRAIKKTHNEEESIDWQISYEDKRGLFLSALQNKTSIDVLIIEPNTNFGNIGYKLEKNKTLIIAKNAKSYWTGEYSRGNIINNGEAYQICARTENGIQINNGIINYSFASSATGGLQINNYNSFSGEHLAHNAKGGLQINIGHANTFAYGIEGGMQINLGISRKFTRFLYDREYKIGGIKIDLSYPPKLNEKQKELRTQLQNKIEELDFLKKAKLDDKTINRIKKYDFNKFEEETKKICEEIAECCEKV